MTNSQKKRIETLRKKGIYHTPKIESFICRKCGKKFEYDTQRKNVQKYFSNGFCSNKCYSESGQKKIDKMKQTLINNEIAFADTDDAIEKYSIFQSNLNKSCADKWRKTMVEKYGKNYASDRSKIGWENSKKEFLLKHNLISSEELKNLTQHDIDTLFKENFNEITKRGEQIKAGRLKKYNNDYEEYKASYRRALVKRIVLYMEKQYGKDYIEKLNDDEYKTLFDESRNYLMVTKKMGPKDKEILLKWKRSHLINHGMDKTTVLALSDDEVNEHYRTYVINRTKFLPNSTKNGYQHTKKGWFKFRKWNDFFYRSSWEEHVCNILDGLGGIIDNVSTPEPIQYVFDNKCHNYFSDFKITFNNGKELYIEVKPNRKVVTPINEAKFKYAREVLNEKFMIATENEIFSDELKNKLFQYYDS